MHRTNPVKWAVVALIIIAGIQLSACAQQPDPPSKIEPAEIEDIPDSDFSRVTLTEKAAERIGLETVPVIEEQMTRTRIVGGQIEALPEAEGGNRSAVWVRVPINVADLDEVAQGEPAFVLPLSPDNEADGLMAEVVETPTDDNADGVNTALYYLVDSPGHGLVPGQRVRVELTLAGSEMEQLVVPYAAVIYGLNGETWAYTSPEPLTFVRHLISIDYIEGDLAVLSEGPPAGTAVVTVGAVELFGAEFGIGK